MFNPLAQKTTKEVVQYLPAGFSICDIGNQTMSHGPDLTVKQYYETLGAARYIALDVNERKDAIVCDLNYDVVNQIGDEKFDLVVNNGSSEHVFSQGQVFQNIHKLCRQNGIMLHILPLTPWINHGFYNYNPIFFRDLARANNYKILFYWLGNRWGETEDWTNQQDKLFREKNPTALEKAIGRLYNKAPIHRDIFNVVALQKLEDKPFQYGLQGKYLGDVEGNIGSV